LGVEVNEEDSATCFSRACRQMDGGGGFTHPSLLIYDGNNAHRKWNGGGGWVVEVIRRIGSLDLWEGLPIF
jgi:hypothetical protein